MPSNVSWETSLASMGYSEDSFHLLTTIACALNSVFPTIRSYLLWEVQLHSSSTIVTLWNLYQSNIWSHVLSIPSNVLVVLPMVYLAASWILHQIACTPNLLTVVFHVILTLQYLFYNQHPFGFKPLNFYGKNLTNQRVLVCKNMLVNHISYYLRLNSSIDD